MQNNERKCPHCEAVLEDDAIFCVECGNTTIIEPVTEVVENQPVNNLVGEQLPPPIFEIPSKLGQTTIFSNPIPANVSQNPINYSATVSSLTIRYQDGYRVAKTIDTFGTILKILGVVLGGGMIFLGLISGGIAQSSIKQNSFGMNDGGVAMLFILIYFGVIGAIIIIVFWILGVIISAQGQMLKANFDCAVNSSPFLENSDRAKIMSLPI